MTQKLNIVKTFLLVTLLFFGSTLFGQSLQYENQLIESIEVKIQGPCENFDDAIILNRIKTRKGDHFSQSDFDNDLKTLSQDYDRIEPYFEDHDGKTFIVLKVWHKPTIRSINWSGNEKVQLKHLQKELKIPCFSVFDKRAFNTAFHALKAYYVKEGFFEAELTYNIALDPATNEVDIDICIIEGRAGRIKEICLINFSPHEKEELHERMVTKKYNFFTSWLSNEGTYNEDAIAHDQANIINYLHDRGYADATVDIKVAEAEEDNRIIIVVTACKGSIYRVGDVEITGNCLFSTEDILRQFTFHEGSVYSPDNIRKTIDNINNLYGRKGYIDTAIDHEPTLSDCEECVYNIKFDVEEGELYRVGLIKVFGNCQTQTHVILHETLLIPGEVFNVEKMKKTEERLSNVGYFSHVNVYAVKSEGPSSIGENYRDVHIEVEETSTGNFGAFAGFSTSESVFGGINVTEKNFNYKGLPCLFSKGYQALRGGGEYAHATATLGSKSRSYVFSWTKPYFNDTKWTVGFDLENTCNRYIADDYEIKTYGGTLNATYQVNPFVRVGWHYRLKHSDIEADREILRELTGNKEKRELFNRGMVSATGLTWSYDSTDHPLKPTTGIKSRFEVEIAGLGGNFTFFSTAYTNSWYHSLDKKTIIKARGDLRFILPFGRTTSEKMPLDERLFLGGDNTVRGYRPYRLGPLFEKNDPRGGMSMQIYSLELSRRLMKNLEMFTFFDAGHLSFAKFDFGLEDTRVFTSVGFGIRFKLLESIPPLTMGYGAPINPKNRSEVKNFFISVGGKF
jgi:outer membrane protein insertion porin family